MKNTVMTIGNFDGLHLGHLKLITKVTQLAEKHKMSSLVCSFDTNTKDYHELLFPQNQLKEYLPELNIRQYKRLKFLESIKNLSCEDFVTKYIVNEYNAKYVVVGEDFRFGKEKTGDPTTLKDLGKKHGFKTVVLKLLKREGRTISSTYIRELIKNGRLAKANSLMYKPISVYGRVKKGYNIGSKLLFPTANIDIPKKIIPIKQGVYKTRVTIENTEYTGVTNLGYAPIKRKKKPIIETHILSLSEDIYEKRIKIEFLKYIRNEQKFKSIEELRKQIEKDIEKAKR